MPGAALHRRCRGLADFWWSDRGLSAMLLCLFVLLFLGPVLDSRPIRIVTGVFFSILFIAGVVNVAQRPIPRLLAASVAAVAILLRWIDRLGASLHVRLWADVAALAFLVLLTGVLMARVFWEGGEVTVHRVRGAVAVYVLLGMTWAVLYEVLAQAVPGAFSFPPGASDDAVTMQQHLTYFSFITLTTLGYGDITAVHPLARMFAIAEALVGQLYPATLLARLVSLEVGSRR